MLAVCLERPGSYSSSTQKQESLFSHFLKENTLKPEPTKRTPSDISEFVNRVRSKISNSWRHEIKMLPSRSELSLWPLDNGRSSISVNTFLLGEFTVKLSQNCRPARVDWSPASKRIDRALRCHFEHRKRGALSMFLHAPISDCCHPRPNWSMSKQLVDYYHFTRSRLVVLQPISASTIASDTTHSSFSSEK